MDGPHRFVFPRPRLGSRGLDLHKLAFAAVLAATPAIAFAADDDWQAQVGQALGKPARRWPAGFIASRCRVPISNPRWTASN